MSDQIELHVGDVFATPFESGCVVTSEPDQFGQFGALDSEGVECGYSLKMVASVTRTKAPDPIDEIDASLESAIRAADELVDELTQDADSAIRTRRALATILPAKVAAKAQREHLADSYAAGALRLLAIVPESLWAESISPIHIDFDALLESVRKRPSDDRTRLVFELAALLYGRQYMPYDVLPRFLKYVDDEDLVAGFDAMRIAREGLEP